MDYFHRRNRPATEYSGHDEVSTNLRLRLVEILNEYVVNTSSEGFYLSADRLLFLCRQQFPGKKPVELLSGGNHYEAFALVEVLSDYTSELDTDRARSIRRELADAFRLSGSVYRLQNGRVELIPSEATAKRLAEVATILAPYESCHATFFTAVGDLMGRRRKPDDIVKDLFVGAEGYLKKVTGKNDYGAAVKALGKAGVVNAIQGAVMEKLYGYRSDAQGVGHAGNSPAPTETDALWFLETMLAQLALVDRSAKRKAA